MERTLDTQQIGIRSLQAVIIVCVAYIVAQLFSDIGSLRIVFIAGFSIDAGTLVYPFTFTLRDLVHKTAGIAVARMLIVAAALINILMAVFFQMVASLPADSSVGAQSEFGLVLAPVWRIVFASIVAELVSELLDTEAYQRFVARFGHRRQWMRVLVSNAISIPLDSLLFCVLAFAGDLPSEVVVSIVIANILIKGAVTLVSLPMIYAVKGK